MIRDEKFAASAKVCVADGRQMSRDWRKYQACSKQEVPTMRGKYRPNRQGWHSGITTAEKTDARPQLFKHLREQSATVMTGNDPRG